MQLNQLGFDHAERLPMPDVSVIIASVNGPAVLKPCIDALLHQHGDIPAEIIVVDVTGTPPMTSTHPAVTIHWIPCADRLSIPALRTIGLAHSKGRIIAITEDHCVADPGWMQTIVSTFQAHPECGVIGGVVDNGSRDRWIDWAVFFCEYGPFMPPRTRGYTPMIPGNNVAYLRSVFDTLPAEMQSALRTTFWESALHPWLQRHGTRFFLEPNMIVYHRKPFAFGYYARQRYHYSRYYAGTLYNRRGRMYGCLRAVLSTVLPPVLTIRIVRRVWQKRRYRRELLYTLPLIAAFTTIWAYGEMVGSLFGAGNSLQSIE